MNYIPKTIAIIVFLLSSSLMWGQDGSITGMVIDNEFNEPLAFTNINVKGSAVAITSDFDGLYTLDLKPGRYSVVFSFAGYKSIEIDDVEVKADQSTQLDITMMAHALKPEVLTSSAIRNNE